MPLEFSYMLRSLCIPDVRRIICTRSDYPLSVRAKDDAVDSSLESIEHNDEQSCLRLPNSYCPVRARRRDFFTVCTICSVQHFIGVPNKRSNEATSTSLPYDRCPIGAGRNDMAPIRAVLRAVDGTVMILELNEGSPSICIPNSCNLVLACGDDVATVRAKRRRTEFYRHGGLIQ